MISKRLISHVNLGYEEVVPGRLLHVRLHFALYSFDLLAVYQHVDNHSVEQMNLRSQFWTKLDEYMFTLPARNQLVCCGDFNCAMTQASPWVGTSYFRWHGKLQQGHQHRDMHRLQQLLQRHSMTATNTWSSAIGPSYFHGMYAARIDFFLVRLHSCDGIAKQSHYLNEASFLPVNQTHHFPLECTIPKNHMAYHKNKYVPACTYQQRALCREESLQETSAWLRLSQQVATLCANRTLQASRPIGCIQDMHQEVIPLFQTLFPANQKPSTSTDTGAENHAIQSKWHHRRCIRRIVQQTDRKSLRHILQAWYHWGRFRNLQRTHQRLTRQVRQQRFDQLCAEATHAANANDAHGLFTIINKYTPKRPLLRARLKTLDGKIADQHTAHALTVEHIRHTWQGQVVMPTFSDHAPGVPISCSDIERAIMQLHPNRSVACPFLPAIVWKSAPRELAILIHALLESWWNHPEPLIPQEWRDAWMFFLPKPGKPSTHPSQLRPIALMEPIGKLVLGLLTEQLKSFHLSRLCSQPHFGFLPLRGALDAVTRVAEHCRHIRTLIANQKRTVARQMATKPLYTFFGGLQMFLDLKHAFDSVNRPLLFEHLKELQTPHPLLHLISSWHVGTRYNLVHNGRTTYVDVDTGLRQGCKAAPLLWALFMNRFLQLLMDKVGQSWIVENVTLYADDIHVGAAFFSTIEFQHCLYCFGCVLDAIETLKLQLSYDKTFVILATTGSGQKRNLKGVVERNSSGATILLPRANQPKSAIPLKAKGRYLGTELSYGPFEQLTWTFRLKAAKSAFARLQCWFKSRQFPVQHRIYLWKVCVLSIMHYGICATSVTVKILHEYQQTIYRMMRTVLHNHSYRTRETHQQVFQSVGLEQPLQLLANHVTTFWRRLQRRALAVHSTDFVHNVNWTHLPEMLKLIHCVAATAVEVPVASEASDPVQTQAQHHCPYCDFRTSNIPNLRRHMTHVHSCSQFRTSSISPLDMSMGGRPQCKGCYSVFTTWRRFFIHVERNCCQVLDERCTRPMHSSSGMDHSHPTVRHPEGPVMTGPMRSTSSSANVSFAASVETFWPLLTTIVQTGNFERLREDPTLGDSLAHNCLICGLWSNRCQELNAHYRLHHSDQLRGALARGAQITHQLATQSPCPLCAKPYRRGHCCPVTTQVAVLQLQSMRPEERESAIKTCTLCAQQFPDMCQLHQHLSQLHGIQIHDWDALTNSTACAHCGASFVTRSGLQRHILDGKCSFFNPDASPQPLDAAAKWHEVLSQGILTRQVLTPAQRQELTLVCQLCGTRYGRQNDLGAHLQQCHGSLWTASQETLRFLIQAVMARSGCQCNPCSHEQGKTHICVLLRQFVMMFMTSANEVLVPTQFTADLLTQLLQPITQLPMYQVVHDVLQTRQFDQLWLTPGTAGLLKNWCVRCGTHYHPAALVVHHWQQHGDHSQWASQIKFQLVSCMLRLQESDVQCLFCGQPINVQEATGSSLDPDRFVNVQTHLASTCPVVHQVALLLHPIHGRANARDGPVRHGTDGVLSTVGTSVAGSQPVQTRKRRGAPAQKSQAGTKQRRARSRTTQASDPSRHDGHDESDGHPLTSTREVHTASASTGLLRYLCPSQPAGGGPIAHQTGCRLEDPLPEGAAGSETSNHENLSVPRPHQGNPSEGQEDGQESPRRRTLGQGHSERSPDAGRVLAVAEVESRGEMPGAGGQDTSEHGQTAEAAAVSGGTAGGLDAHRPLSFIEGPNNGGPMVPSTQHETGGGMDHHGRAAAAEHVEPLGPLCEDPQPSSKSTSSTPPTMPAAADERRQEPGQGEDGRETQDEMTSLNLKQRLRHAFHSLILENGSSFCYANSALLTCLWAMLTRSTFAVSDWGEYSEIFSAILLSPSPDPIALEHTVWFQNLVATWPERHGQADSTEFSSILMRGVAPQCISNRWERRVMSEQKVRVHDCGDETMPITLQLDLNLQDCGSIRLVDLIRHWHQELGMCAALVHAEDLICVQLDRFIMDPTGQVRKSHVPIGFHWGVPFPTFTQDVDCRWEGYQVVAAFAHLGTEDHGHYQAILKVGHESAPGSTPALWLHCDDNRAPKPCWHLPPEFSAGVTCFWLCRCEQLDLYDMRTAPHSAAEPTHNGEGLNHAMLALLDTV